MALRAPAAPLDRPSPRGLVVMLTKVRAGPAACGSAVQGYIRPMCGFTNRLTWPERVRLYRLTLDMPASNTQPRYNICPTTEH